MEIDLPNPLRLPTWLKWMYLASLRASPLVHAEKAPSGALGNRRSVNRVTDGGDCHQQLTWNFLFLCSNFLFLCFTPALFFVLIHYCRRVSLAFIFMRSSAELPGHWVGFIFTSERNKVREDSLSMSSSTTHPLGSYALFFYNINKHNC
jgi:hypothetical protein